MVIESHQKSFVLRRQVTFRETDMAGFVHFSNFFAYMEEAESAFLSHIGFPVVRKEKTAYFGWPKVRAECVYLSPLRFPDFFEVQLSLKEMKIRALVYAFRFYKCLNHQDSSDQKVLVAKGSLSTVYTSFPLDMDQSVAGCSIPSDLESTLRTYLSA